MHDDEYGEQLDREIATLMFGNGTSLSIWKDGTALMFTRTEGHMEGRMTASGMFLDDALRCRYFPDGTAE